MGAEDVGSDAGQIVGAVFEQTGDSALPPSMPRATGLIHVPDEAACGPPRDDRWWQGGYPPTPESAYRGWLARTPLAQRLGRFAQAVRQLV